MGRKLIKMAIAYDFDGTLTDIARRTLLSDLFRDQEANPLSVNALKFPANRDEDLDLIDELAINS
jgi:hypothetical protein